MLQLGHRIVELVLDVIFGSLCPACGARGCGVPCPECARRSRDLRMANGATFEDLWPVRELVRAAKFGRWGSGARWFAAQTLETIADDRERIVAVTSVPGDPGRVRQRGADLPRSVARRIARDLGVPYVQLLVRVRGSRAQRGLHRSERGDNAQASFDVHARVASALERLHQRAWLSQPRAGPRGMVLLIDDVCTTGATLRVCQTLLTIVLRRRFRDVHVRPHAIAAVPPPEPEPAGVSNSRSLRDKCIHVER